MQMSTALYRQNGEAIKLVFKLLLSAALLSHWSSLSPWHESPQGILGLGPTIPLSLSDWPIAHQAQT